MTAADPRSEKLRLRRVMRSRLGELTAEQARAAGAAIADRLARSELWHEATRVGVFASRSDEVDTSLLIERILCAGKQLLLPRTTDSDGLEFVAVADVSQLRAGRFGIREPSPESPVVRPDQTTLLLVPGLAFDRDGGRLGRGGGYYDRTLTRLLGRELRPILIGAGFSFQLVERVPMTTLDVRLDGVVSDEELVETDTSLARRTRAGRVTGRSGRDD